MAHRRSTTQASYIYIYIYIYIYYSCENDIVHHKRWNEIASQNIFKIFSIFSNNNPPSPLTRCNWFCVSFMQRSRFVNTWETNISTPIGQKVIFVIFIAEVSFYFWGFLNNTFVVCREFAQSLPNSWSHWLHHPYAAGPPSSSRHPSSHLRTYSKRTKSSSAAMVAKPPEMKTGTVGSPTIYRLVLILHW